MEHTTLRRLGQSRHLQCPLLGELSPLKKRGKEERKRERRGEGEKGKRGEGEEETKVEREGTGERVEKVRREEWQREEREGKGERGNR